MLPVTSVLELIDGVVKIPSVVLTVSKMVLPVIFFETPSAGKQNKCN